jgi:hypothetical protein
MSGANMGTVPMSKKRKFGPKGEFTVDTRGTGAASIAETVGIKPGASPIEAAAGNSILTGITGEERHQLIAEAAYFRAERRNFTPGYELEDWLDAEAEIEMKLSKIGTESPSRNAQS